LGAIRDEEAVSEPVAFDNPPPYERTNKTQKLMMTHERSKKKNKKKRVAPFLAEFLGLKLT